MEEKIRRLTAECGVVDQSTNRREAGSADCGGADCGVLLYMIQEKQQNVYVIATLLYNKSAKLVARLSFEK